MSVVVLKVGGASTGGIAEAVAELRDTGYSVCVVHGAGPQISAEMARRGLDVEFVDGRRVTTAEGLEVVRESLASVNAAVCAAIGAGCGRRLQATRRGSRQSRFRSSGSSGARCLPHPPSSSRRSLPASCPCSRRSRAAH